MRPTLEIVEDRVLLATYTVTNTNTSGPGSLAQAINNSNGNTTQTNAIHFAITGTSLAIDLTTDLSPITQPVTIDGTTQTGYTGAPIVQIVGSSGATVGLNVQAGGVVIKGLVISGFSGNGIELEGAAGGDSVTECYVGTNVAGSAAQGNGNGIWIASPNDTIGGTTAGSSNLISGNSTGINVTGTNTGTGATLIEGNLIGTDLTGSKAVGNGTGIELNGGPTTVGGTSSAARNIISGNTVGDNGFGLDVESGGNVIEGNDIGTDPTGSDAVGNSTGIFLVGASNTIGGIAAASRNIISGNSSAGIGIYYAHSNVVQGNFIGTDATGMLAIGNGTGISGGGGTANTYGGTAAGAGNVISGNTRAALAVGKSDQVLGNSIGINVAGGVLGNKGDGIDVDAGSDVIGASGAGNVIANNAQGIFVQIYTGKEQIAFNDIINNKGDGVHVEQSVSDSISNNVISGNLGLGIDLDLSAGLPSPNNLLPAPYLTSVTENGGGTDTVTGIIYTNQASTPGYVVQFFANPSYAANGTTSGAVYLGQTTLATNAQSDAPFTFTYTPVAGDPVSSATLTDPSGDTSEFSTRPPAPINSMPASQTLEENSSLTFTNNNAISVAYTNDAGTNDLQFTLNVGEGTLDLPSTTNLTGSGNGTDSLTYSGTLNDINNAIGDLVYTPAANYSGNDELTLVTNNLAGAELGGDQTSTTSTALVIQAPATSPTVSPATTTANTQTSSGLIIVPGNGTPTATNFQITNITGGSLFSSDGTTPVASGSFITIAQGAAGLKFTPANDFIGQAGFTVQSSTSSVAAGLIGTPSNGLITVNQIGSTATVTASASSPSFGHSVTFTATVAPSTATGIITFMDGTTTLGTKTLSGGTASYSTSALGVGSHAITVQYAGDTITLGATSAAVTVAVAQLATTTNVSGPSSAVTVGQSVTLTATVAPSTATGTATFMDGTTTLGTGLLTNGTATYSTTALPVGADSITAKYSGDSNDAASTSSATTVTIDALPTTTSVSTSAASVTSGQSVTFTATVAPSSVTGSINFMDGTTLLGAEPLSSGSASFSTTTLPAGNHTITAAYIGNASDAASTSAPLTETINSPVAANTTTTLTASATSIAFGGSVTFNATVASSVGTPTGTLTFDDGSTVLATETLANGTASFTTTALAIGSHSIVAEYAGVSAAFNASASIPPEAITVTKTSTTTSLMTSAPSASVGQSLTFTATVTPASATGSVTFLDGTTTLGTETLANGTATFSTTDLVIGSHSISAEYLGSSTFGTSASSVIPVSVGTTVTTTSLSASATSVPMGQSVTFMATVSPSSATGTITFIDGTTTLGTETLVGGVATYATSSLAVGNHEIVAQYEGDGNDATSESPGTAIVVQSLVATSAAETMVLLQVGPNPNLYGQSVTLTAVVTGAAGAIVDGGQVHFVDGTDQVGTAPVSNGSAVLSITGLSVGTHYLQAYFEGDDSFAASTSPIETAEIEPAPSVVALMSTPNSATTGSQVSLVAQVASLVPWGASTPSTGPTGFVQFFEGELLLGNADVGSNGVATLTTVLPTSTQIETVHASYIGDGNYLTASSPALNFNPPVAAAVTQNVTPAAAVATNVTSALSQPVRTTTVVSLSVKRTKHKCWRAADLTADVATVSSGTVISDGQVTFTLTHGRKTRKFVAPVENGKASVKFLFMLGHRWLVSASYAGTSVHEASTSLQVKFSSRGLS